MIKITRVFIFNQVLASIMLLISLIIIFPSIKTIKWIEYTADIVNVKNSVNAMNTKENGTIDRYTIELIYKYNIRNKEYYNNVVFYNVSKIKIQEFNSNKIKIKINPNNNQESEIAVSINIFSILFLLLFIIIEVISIKEYILAKRNLTIA